MKGLSLDGQKGALFSNFKPRGSSDDGADMFY